MTARFLIPVLMALTWAAISGSFTVANLLFGLLLGAAALWLLRGARNVTPIRVRPLPLVRLIGVFLVELIKSGLKVMALVLKRDMQLQPGIVAVPLRLTGDFQITLLANLITLTPGTLTVDVAANRSCLYVHCVDASDPQAVIADIRNGFERLVEEAFA
ncbi:Na+/H+ antiporter subunit E [Oryzibacter oryziterrae]|uniref:Na+/H+ antiporter subunit E n=1 Tax=Oryzibacter oryziterrae TaxID=2766474 RepID=UPI001F47CDBE|nr:Na+/H+ antiporter subunit E [Oryzibacter oryziterrae]